MYEEQHMLEDLKTKSREEKFIYFGLLLERGNNCVGKRMMEINPPRKKHYTKVYECDEE